METLLEKSLNKHDFPEKERRELAKEGEAMKDRRCVSSRSRQTA